MARQKKYYDDDDGRTVADMSGIERQRLFVPRIPKKEEPHPRELQLQDAENDPMKDFSVSKDEGRAYVFGALGAALLIGSIFAVAFFLFIVIFLAIYK